MTAVDELRQDFKIGDAMPIRYEIDDASNRVLVTASGEISEDELLQVETALINDPRVKPGFRALFDATRASRVSIADATLDSILDLESHHTEKFMNSRLALVVHDRLGWDRAKYFEVRSSRSVVVFFNLDIAKAWLGFV